MVVLLKQVGVYELTSKLITLKDPLYNSDQFYIDDIFYCDGLLLCNIVNKIRNDDDHVSRVVVWNPILGQIKWIELTNSDSVCDSFVLGHDGKKNYKILRTFYDSSYQERLEIYDCKTNSWMFLDEEDDWSTLERGVSLNGDCYWLGYDESDKDVPMLISFDFSVEKFQGQFVPTRQRRDNCMALSVHREEELLLLNQGDTLKMHISNNKIEKIKKKKTKVFSLSKYLTVDLYTRDINLPDDISFFIMDEKKKTLVCCRTEKHLSSYQAYVIGEEENGVREIDLGEFNFVRGRPLMSSYLPSLVQIH